SSSFVSLFYFYLFYSYRIHAPTYRTLCARRTADGPLITTFPERSGKKPLKPFFFTEGAVILLKCLVQLCDHLRTVFSTSLVEIVKLAAVLPVLRIHFLLPEIMLEAEPRQKVFIQKCRDRPFYSKMRVEHMV